MVALLTMADINDINMVDDIIEIIPAREDEDDVDTTTNTEDQDHGSEFDYEGDSGDDEFLQNDYGIERVVDALGGLFVSSEGVTITDLISKISETLVKHEELMSKQIEAIEKQNKVLFKLAKVIEDSKNQ